MGFALGPFGLRLLLLAAVGAALLWGSLRLMRSPEPSAPAPVAARALYARHCAGCHGPGGKGDGAEAGVIRSLMPDLSDAAAMARATDAYLFEIIKKGSSQFGRSNAMPAWGMQLTDDEIRALVAYIRTLVPPPVPGPSPGKAAP